MDKTNENIVTVYEGGECQLSIQQYIIESKVNIDNLYVDRFWSNLHDNKWVYVDDDLIRWMGYTSANISKSKSDFIKILADNFPDDGSVYKRYRNKEFKEKYAGGDDTILNNLDNSEKIIFTSNRTVHLIITLDCLRYACMLITTEKAKQIKMYFLTLDKVFRGYRHYVSQYNMSVIRVRENRLLLESKHMVEERDAQIEELRQKEAKIRHSLTNLVNTLTSEQIIATVVEMSMETKELIAEEQIAQLLGYTETDIEHLSGFWPMIEHDDGMFHLSGDMITRLIKDGSTIEDFYNEKLICDEFIEGIDYAEVYIEDNKNPSCGKQKLYKVTVDCYERLLVKSNTADNVLVRNCLSKIRKLSKFKTRAVAKFRERVIQYNAQVEKEQILFESKQAMESKERDLRQAEIRAEKAEAETKRALEYAHSVLSKLKPGKIDGTIYIRADEESMKRCTTKNGGTTNEKSRKNTYGTGRTRDNKLTLLKEYPCHNYHRAEYLIKAVMGHCRENTKAEMFTLPYPQMKNIMDAIMLTYNCFTGIMNDIIENKEQILMTSEKFDIKRAISHTEEDDRTNPMNLDKLFALFSKGNEKFNSIMPQNNIGVNINKNLLVDCLRTEAYIPTPDGKVKCELCQKTVSKNSLYSHKKSTAHRDNKDRYAKMGKPAR